ncbi:MAG TPA: HAMP domain-containing sensor histidine kinase [Candidatus Tectomicrobia bacterium]|nr:HAMP domain-containing sensor histidine kinase [Candidatus Tectomicrobia bacterium]
MLFREQARDVATMAAEKVEMMLRHAEEEFLDRLQAALATAATPPADAVEALVAATPIVGRLYLFGADGALRYPAAWRDPGDRAVFEPVVRGLSRLSWDRAGKREVMPGEQVCVAVLLTAGQPVLVAYSRNLEALRHDILATSLAALESPTNLAVLDDAGRPIYSRAPLGPGEPVLAVDFGAELPRWRVAVYAPPGSSPRDAVRRQVMLFTAAFGILVAVIVAGSAVTWRLMRREAEMAQLKSDFVANVSHDLKTPLSVIRMFGETLEMGRVRDEARRQEYYRVITRESERLSRLIDNVLDFSRIEGGRQRYDVAPAAIEPLVRDAVEAFAYPLEQQGFTVKVDVEPDLPDVPLDADAVGQALANLIDNAIKYSAERKAIAVFAARDGDWLRLEVADEGIGIPPSEHRRIFEKFYRVGRSETQGRRGSGVGLALVRHVAEAHGGSVTVESAPGAGSRFTIRLPLAGPPG